jgi:aminopeptidase N
LNKFELKARSFGRIGFGNTPLESALYLSGASPEEIYANKYTRAAGFIPQDWMGYGANVNHFHLGGGLNLRGYAGYLSPQENGNDQIFNNVGKSGASVSIELDFDKFIPIKANKYTKNIHFDTYLFHDMGVLTYSLANQTEQKIGKLRTSSGLGSMMTIKFGHLNVKPLAIRFDMPLLLNAPPAGQDYFQWRFVIGLNRSF